MVLFLTKSHIEHDFIIVAIIFDDITIDEKISDTEMEKFYHDHSHWDTQSQMHAVSMLKFRSDDFKKLFPFQMKKYWQHFSRKMKIILKISNF
jgi:hypothetical protein